jgi:lipopolysaccharide transport system ATP-binding protein
MAAIQVEKLGKQFRRFHPERPTTVAETFAHGLRRLRPTDRFWALRDVSFSVKSGEMLGVIGGNGAGKSTLLRLLGGVGLPDEGSVKVNGRIGALLDLGTGFHPELTGHENLYIAGVIGGLTRREITQRFDEIVAFAELEDFIDSPLRIYSTGMQMRLAFAVAVHIEPDILLIDEVLAVGDIAFQRKCLDRIGQFKKQGCAVVLVSHEAALVRQMCDQALWLRHGEVVAQGEADIVVGQYVAEMTAETKRRTPQDQPPILTPGGTELAINKNRFGSLEAEVTGVNLCDAQNRPVTEITSGQPLNVTISYQASIPMAPIFGLTISRPDGFICYDTSTAATGLATPTLTGNGQILLSLERLDLIPGDYFVDVGIYEHNWAYAYDYHWHVYPLTVAGNSLEKGVLRPPHRWELQMP